MAKLYELTEAYAKLAELDVEEFDEATGEVSRPFEAELATLSGAIDDKVEGCARVIRNLGADVDALEKEEKRLYARRKAVENKLERLKEYLRVNMALANKSRVKTTLFSVSLGEEKLVVEVFDDALVPDDLRLEAKKPAASKKAVEEAIDGGREVPGARMVPGKRTLTIR